VVAHAPVTQTFSLWLTPYRRRGCEEAENANSSRATATGRRDEVWKKYCGFLDLSLKEFMEIQERLLVEQIDLLGRCDLGRKFLRSSATSVDEFREVVPLTTYRIISPI